MKVYGYSAVAIRLMMMVTLTSSVTIPENEGYRKEAIAATVTQSTFLLPI